MLVELKTKIDTLKNVENTFNKAYAKVVEKCSEHKVEMRIIDKLHDDYLRVKIYVGANEELSEEVYKIMENFGFTGEVLITSQDYVIDCVIDL